MKILVHRLIVFILIINVLSLGILPEVRAALMCDLKQQDEMVMYMHSDQSACDCPDSCAPQDMQVDIQCYKACYTQHQYPTVISSALPVKHDKEIPHRPQAPPDSLISPSPFSGTSYDAPSMAAHLVSIHPGTDTYLITQRLRI